MEFFMLFVNANSEKICIENPIGYVSTAYRKPDQIVQPYQYGHPESKATCFWLKGLPKLIPTNIVEPIYKISAKGERFSPIHWGSWGHKDRWKMRSRTFTGIAEAMADQWGSL